MTSNDHGLPAQVKSASLTLTLRHCALHFSQKGHQALDFKIASLKYHGHPPDPTFQLLKKPTNVLLATTPFLEARGSSASAFLRWLWRKLWHIAISCPSKFRPWRRSDPQTAEYSLLPGDSTWCSITECLNHWRRERLCHSAVAGIASMHWVTLVSRQSRVRLLGQRSVWTPPLRRLNSGPTYHHAHTKVAAHGTHLLDLLLSGSFFPYHIAKFIFLDGLGMMGYARSPVSFQRSRRSQKNISNMSCGKIRR